LYHCLALLTNQQEYDRNNDGFLSSSEILFYFKKNRVWGVITIIVTTILLLEARSIWDITVKPWWGFEFSNLAYVGLSGLMVLLQMGIDKYKDTLKSKKK
jgi:hypothetical protein